MANVLGSLLVELGINTAAFTEGLTKATYSAKASTQQIGASLQGIGGALTSVGARFGEFGGVVGAALGTVGASISKLAKGMSGDFSSIGGTLKIGGVAFAALAAGSVTAGAAIIGIAAHAAEGAKRLYDLSQATGVSVHELSGLSIVGKLVGLDTDTMARALERMSRSAMVAAESPNRASNAYRTLGISVTDASGHMRSASDILADVADKFSKMQDGTAKTALAMQIFGRAGAEMIPMLNNGSEALKYWVGYGEQVGAVLSNETAKGAEAFHQELTKLELISTGVQNKLMTALLPALDHITSAIATLLGKGPQVSTFGELVGNAMIAIARWVLDAIETVDLLENKWDHASIAMEKFYRNAKDVLSGAALKGNWSNVDDLNSRLAASDATLQKLQDRLALARADLGSRVISPAAPELGPGGRTAAPIAGASPTAAARLPIDEVAKYIATLEQETAVQIKLASSVANTTQAIQQQEARAAAETEVFKLREGLVTKQTSLEESLAKAKLDHSAVGDKQIKQLTAELEFIGKEITELDTNKEHIIALIEAKKQAASDTAFAKSIVAEREKIEANIAGLKEETAAVFESAAARRAAAVDKKAAELTAKAPAGFDQTAIVNALKAQSDAEYQLKVAQEAATLSTRKGYDDEIQLIKDVMDEYKDNRDIQLAGAAALQNAQNKVTEAWDVNALAVGNFGEKAKAVLNQLQIESQNTGKKIADAMKTAFDGIAKNLADMVVTGKSNFKALFQSLEQQILQALLSKALNDLINKLANALGGGGAGGGSKTGGVGGFLSSIGSALFGGFKAGGGPVAPGVAYMVGEQGPEAFIPSSPGTIVPNSATIRSMPFQGQINVHVNGASDPDTFRKASPQIATSLYSQMRLAAARNMGGG